jgi:hypothetical protein
MTFTVGRQAGSFTLASLVENIVGAGYLNQSGKSESASLQVFGTFYPVLSSL